MEICSIYHPDKLKLYSSCVLRVLLYGSECWKMTEQDQNKLSVFHTKSMRRILRIFWPHKISTEDLFIRCQQQDIATTIMRRRWRRIGHVLRKNQEDITKTELHGTPEGKRKRGRPKMTWRRTVEAEANKYQQTLGTLQKTINDRHKWKIFVTALHANGVQG